MNSVDGTKGCFFKLQALGNDFVLIDARTSTFSPGKFGPRESGLPGDRMEVSSIRALANRRTGIGFDQLLVLRPGDTHALADIEIYNADGSSAEQCGNGMRAIAAWLERRGELADRTRVETPAGPVFLARSAEHGFTADLPGPEPLDAVTMGLAPRSLPADVLDWRMVSVGNPHLVVDWPERPTRNALAEFVTALERTDWHGRVNIGLMHPASADTVDLRVHERGAGPTLACGSAACAAAWAMRTTRPDGGPVTVRQPGGTLVVDLDPSAGRVTTSGSACVVFEGKII